MTRIFAACLVTVAAVIAAPHAAADPPDLVPYCSGDHTPMDDNCLPMAHQNLTHDGSDVDPELPSGVDRGNEPVVGSGD
jgi:hypothetical protein